MLKYFLESQWLVSYIILCFSECWLLSYSKNRNCLAYKSYSCSNLQHLPVDARGKPFTSFFWPSTMNLHREINFNHWTFFEIWITFQYQRKKPLIPRGYLSWLVSIVLFLQNYGVLWSYKNTGAPFWFYYTSRWWTH